MKKVKRRVLKCDKYGKVLKEYRDVDEAAIDMDSRRSALYLALWRGGMNNGFRWMYKEAANKREAV